MGKIIGNEVNRDTLTRDPPYRYFEHQNSFRKRRFIQETNNEDRQDICDLL